jgi:hypothetical protein
VIHPSGETKEYDDDGTISFKWKLNSHSDTGIFEFDITASAAGHEEISKSQTFEAIGGEEDEDKQSSEEEEN